MTILLQKLIPIHISGEVECGRQECRRVAHAPQSTRVSEPFSVSSQVGNLAADEQRQVGLRDPPILQQ